MAIKVGINGFGRIGRLAFRLLANDPQFEVVGINDLTDAETLAYLLKYDTAQGRYRVNEVSYEGSELVVSGKHINIYAVKNPAELPWGKLGVDVVLECTGLFLDYAKAHAHIEAGAKKVVLSAPHTEKDDVLKKQIKTIVYGVNDSILDGTEEIISGASCTTNCLAPLCKVLDENFGIVGGMMTTVHSFTNDQSLMDQPHKKGILSRRGRAASYSIIPSSTGAAKAISLVLPQLKGKLDGTALRVPTITGSVVDLTVQLEKTVTAEDIDAAFKKASNGTSLVYCADPIVSADIVGSEVGSTYDAHTTQVITLKDGKQYVKVMSWYDNEMSYTAQLIRTVQKLGKLLKK